MKKVAIHVVICFVLALMAGQTIASAKQFIDEKHVKDLHREVARLKQRQQVSQQLDYLGFDESLFDDDLDFTIVSGGVVYDREVEPGDSADEAKIIAGKTLTYIAGTPVVTSPYLGKRTAFDGSDLIVQITSINLDARLLEQTMLLEDALVDKGFPLPDHPIIELSGKLEARAYGQKPYVGHTTGDLNLSAAELIVVAQMSPWFLGYSDLEYEDSRPAVTGRRIDNSNVKIRQAFMTVGNFNRSPFYGTLGQIFVPFGRYSSYMVTSPLTLVLGRTKARALNLGFKHHGFFGMVYGFRGETGTQEKIAGGGTLGYGFSNDHRRAEVSVGVLSNLAESDGMQHSGRSDFRGFGASPATERTLKRVPAVDIQAKVGINQWSFIGELVAATARFNPMDLSQNGVGAKPMALNVEGAYSFEFFQRPGAIALGYGWSDDGLALNLPKQSFKTTFNTSFWRDTIQSIELRHDINYAAGTTAGGRGMLGCDPGMVTCFVPVMSGGTLGHSATTVTAQVGYYF